MYSGERYENNPSDWIDILEEHFKERRKAFLVFDNDHLLKYVSEYASDLLEIRSNQRKGICDGSRRSRTGNVPNMLVDSNYLFKKVRDITYTTPSGKPVDIRFNLDQKPGMNGYVIWVELRERELTGTYRKISSLKPYSDMKHIFDSFKMGFLILDKNGVVVDLNDHIKHLLRLPGEWEGCNLFTFPPLHQNKLSDFIRKCITGRSKHNSKVFKIKYSSNADSVHIRMSGVQLYDLTGATLGALISCKTED